MLGVALPLVLLILVMAILRYDKLVWLVVIFTPLSVELRQIVPGLPIDMHIPTEPILVGILLLFIMAWFSGKRIDKKIVNHRVSWAIYIYLLWMLVTTITSTLPIVSLKMLLTRIWFIVVFFFILAYMFKQPKNMEKLIWFYVVAMIPVIFFSIYRHLGYGLYDKQAANWVMHPFFNDHTSYGAALAMFIPMLIMFTFSRYISFRKRMWAALILAIFTVAIILSYTRAAWLSLIVGLGVWCIMKLKIKFRSIIIVIVAAFALAFAFQDQILMGLEKNSQDSSTNLYEHLTSMTNISTDASNLERINRWDCALSMFEEKPFLGWGQGTYAMQYGAFQLSKNRTIISTNYGDGGNAHSEYLGSLAEAGVFGLITYLLLIAVVLYTGITAYSRTKNKQLKGWLLAAIVGLITYYFHGILNNFLDTDKISLPFWGFTAMIVMIDIKIREENETSNVEASNTVCSSKNLD